MIAIEYLSDIGKRHLGNLTNNVHGNVARVGNLLVSLCGDEILLLDAVLLVNRGENLFNGNACGLGTAEELGNATAGEIHINLLAGEENSRAELFDSALNLTNVGTKVLREEREHVLGKLNANLLRLLLDNRNAKLKVGRLNIRDKTPLKASFKSILKSFNLARLTVACENDLLSALVERVEGVEELFLCGHLAANELNVVDEEHVAIAVLLTELGHCLT